MDALTVFDVYMFMAQNRTADLTCWAESDARALQCVHQAAEKLTALASRIESEIKSKMCATCHKTLKATVLSYTLDARVYCLSCAKTYADEHEATLPIKAVALLRSDYCKVHCSFEGTYRHVCGRNERDGLGARKPEYIMCFDCNAYIGRDGKRRSVKRDHWMHVVCLACAGRESVV